MYVNGFVSFAWYLGCCPNTAIAAATVNVVVGAYAAAAVDNNDVADAADEPPLPAPAPVIETLPAMLVVAAAAAAADYRSEISQYQAV